MSLQIAAAVALDLIGAVGYVRRSFTWQRMLGVALMAGGVALITCYPGVPMGREDGGAARPIGRALTHLYVRSSRVEAGSRGGGSGRGGVGSGNSKVAVLPLSLEGGSPS